MRKTLSAALVAVSVSAATVAAPSKAQATCWGCWAGAGIFAAVLGGALISNAYARNSYYGSYGYYGGYGYSPYSYYGGYGYAPAYYAPRYRYYGYAPVYRTRAYYGGYLPYRAYYGGYYAPRRAYARAYYRHW